MRVGPIHKTDVYQSPHRLHPVIKPSSASGNHCFACYRAKQGIIIMRLSHVLLVSVCLAATGTANASSLSLSFIGQQILPTATFYGGTQVGGLSGIDYIGHGQYVAISDDRSQINDARFYTLGLSLTPTSFSGVTFNAVTTLKTPAGTPYAALQIDPESIRKLSNGNFIYSSEGDTNRNIDAFIRETKLNGDYVRDYTIPGTFQQTGPAGTTGIRNNLAFESLALANGGATTVSATENALRQDGPAASFGVASPSRIITFDTVTGAPGAQFVYNVAPVANPTTPAGQFSTNGLVELLSLGGTKYLALERSFVSGYVTPVSSTGNSIQIYEIDTAGATDVSEFASLAGQSYTPVSKNLLFDLDSLGLPLDNIEGISFGGRLSNGHRSLILVSDNNFSPTQFTQFLAFDAGAVPEPSSWAMMVAGFGLIGGAMRRRKTVAVHA
jgi:hypothetical protein